MVNEAPDQHLLLVEGLATGGIGSWIDCYNKSRPHSALAGRTPEEAYYERLTPSPRHAPEMASEALAA